MKTSERIRQLMADFFLLKILFTFVNYGRLHNGETTKV